MNGHDERDERDERDEIVAALEAAVGLADTSLVVRSAYAIAEVRGPLKLRRGVQWLTIGEESGSHVHLKPEDIRRLRFSQPGDGNASLEVLGSEDTLICRVVFRKTNPARSETYDQERAVSVRARFAGLA